MTEAQFLMATALAAPLIQATIVAAARAPGLRDVAHVLGAAVTAAACLALCEAAQSGPLGPALTVSRPAPGLAVGFLPDRLGLATAAMTACVGVLGAVFATGWARWRRDAAAGRFMAFSAIATGAAIATALAADLLTLFIGYQMLALATFALLAHGAEDDPERSGAAALFLLSVAGLAMAAFLPAALWTGQIAGGFAFDGPALLTGKLEALGANALLCLFVLGLALPAALFPTHRWLFSNRRAAAPAVAQAFGYGGAAIGAFCLLRVSQDVFGPAMAQAAIAAAFFFWAALATAIGAAIAAFAQKQVSGRLACVCAAQLATILAAAMLPSAAGEGAAAFAGGLRLIAYAMAASALFFGAGALTAALGEGDVHAGLQLSDLVRLGPALPWAGGAFAAAALSLGGAPPFAGAWPTLWLMIASAEAGRWAAALTIGAVALLSFWALAAPAWNALFAKPDYSARLRPDGPGPTLLAPALLAGLSTLLLLPFMNALATFLAGDAAP